MSLTLTTDLHTATQTLTAGAAAVDLTDMTYTFASARPVKVMSILTVEFKVTGAHWEWINAVFEADGNVVDDWKLQRRDATTWSLSLIRGRSLHAYAELPAGSHTVKWRAHATPTTELYAKQMTTMVVPA